MDGGTRRDGWRGGLPVHFSTHHSYTTHYSRMDLSRCKSREALVVDATDVDIGAVVDPSDLHCVPDLQQYVCN